MKRTNPFHSVDASGLVAVAELAARQDAFESDLRNISKSVGDLAARIDNLGSSINAKIDQRSQPQWQTYIAGAMLLGGMFFAFISPIQKQQDAQQVTLLAGDKDLKDLIGRVSERVTNNELRYLSKPEHDEFKARILGDIDKIDKRVTVLDTTRPTTGELQAVATSTQRTADKLDERVRSLENKR